MSQLLPLRLAAAALLAGLSCLLSGCLIAPGKFDASLALFENRSFTFTYEGEIYFLGLSGLSQMGAASETFEAECTNPETGDPRNCTPAELERQRAEWEAGAEQRAAEAKAQAEQMAAMMGEVDPSDPEAARELANMLMRQKGWDRVVPKGDGVFDVSYAITGTMDHDFLFPMIEGMPTTSPFVQFFLRDNDIVRINAPAFAAQNDNNPMAAMMGGMGAFAGLAAMSDEDEQNGETPPSLPPEFPQIEGTFTVVTRGDIEIRANNTDEGPTRTPTGRVLTWEISPRTATFPTALIDLTP
jgi:hypothetical protein